MPYYYGYGFGIDPLYLLVVLVCTVLGLAAQNYINSTVQNLVQGSLGRRYGCHSRSPHARCQRL